MSKKIFFFFFVLLIIGGSFITLSPNFSPEFNSDGAVSVLMTYYFKIPRDLYYWGQDRGGSLIPLVGNFIYKLSGLPVVTSVSISLYLFLIGGFIGFCRLLQSNFLKLLLALFWFLPLFLFSDLIWYTIGLQCSLIGMCVYFFSIIKNPKDKDRRIYNLIFIFVIDILFILAQWVSDLSIVSSLSFLIIYCFFEFKYYDKYFKQFYTILLVAGIILSLVITHYLKTFCKVYQEDYGTINNFHDILNSIKIIWDSFLEYLFFKNEDYYLCISVYLGVLLLAAITFLIIRRKIAFRNESKKWVYILSLNILLTILVILISHWVLLNNMGRRYFISIYIFTSMIVLVIIENLNLKKNSLRFINIISGGIAIIFAFSSIYHFKFISPKTLRPEVSTVSEFEKLGKIGIIAEYWNGYISSVSCPQQIVSTPHDKENVRNYELVEKVFAQPLLYIIRDQWMQSFPDSLTQFNHLLVRNGEPFRIADCDVCNYKMISK